MATSLPLTDRQLEIQNGPLELRNLLFVTARDHGVLLEELVGRSHEARLVSVRRVFCKRARELKFSLPVIGRALGRHHTTILNLLS